MAGHDNPVTCENGHVILAAIDDPIDNIEPLQIPDGQPERDAALQAIEWILMTVGPRAIVAKVLAFRYILHLESRPMEVVGKEYGLCRASISTWVTTFADQLQFPALKSGKARKHFSEAQRKVWETRSRRNKPETTHDETDKGLSLTTWPA